MTSSRDLPSILTVSHTLSSHGLYLFILLPIKLPRLEIFPYAKKVKWTQFMIAFLFNFYLLFSYRVSFIIFSQECLYSLEIVVLVSKIVIYMDLTTVIFFPLIYVFFKTINSFVMLQSVSEIIHSLSSSIFSVKWAYTNYYLPISLIMSKIFYDIIPHKFGHIYYIG